MSGQAAGRALGVLGIDAAWTSKNASGVALALQTKRGWRLARVASSYAAFLSDVPGLDAIRDTSGGEPPVDALVARCVDLGGPAIPSVVAADIPLSRTPITVRRACDNAISSRFGGRGISAHSPSADRPGPIADRLRAAWEQAGVRLATSSTGPAARGSKARGHASPALLEVYPHTGVLALRRADYRVPYKAARARKYWPDDPPDVRVRKLLREWTAIVAALDADLPGTAAALGSPADLTPGERKAYEDALDAVVCCWIGMAFLEGRAEAIGDADSAIWVPRAALAAG
ncbi:MAG: DUF429 domain-containing protein [Deltaproteobacteria bacterium]|nr:DUF429 domain-containing protein [Deltaproteobacteria bacterium]